MTTHSYPDTKLLIDGHWRAGAGEDIDVINPATGERIGTLSHARSSDLDEALAAAEKGLAVWRKVNALERSRAMRKAAGLLRERIEYIAQVLTQEQGKPLKEARIEVLSVADVIDWFAEEARRTYGRVIPARADNISQLVIKEPVGVVAAFTPWNFPLNQATRKISAALAAGCSVILKGPEETPASCAALANAFQDAGLPPGVLNLVFGVPAEISNYLIPHPTVRKISFTGSTAVGKQLAALAGAHMKRVTMELGGHAPSLIFEDADIDAAVTRLAASKYRNAGQVCIAPTRFIVHETVFDRFVDGLVAVSEELKVGNGLDQGVTMGAMANPRRVQAMEELTADAIAQGATLRTGGKRIGDRGNFFAPTVLTDVPLTARAMNEEPFGPMALVNRYATHEDMLAEANRLPYGLAAYAFTASAKIISDLSRDIESGMLSVNHHGLGLPEMPFGGVQDSGYGSEGGLEAMEAYLNTKVVTQMH
ncbi:NAD-dependent succinate-semialdehyde dehydrogenase [Paracandidimonas soli]|uniref:Succinate-semialdehyde dehydrogenase/glutarate-semialdehyde dehydrogenase n=1 Tax=Paracandidimonas soli TaxID=1917182 RepID=A0A4R3V1P8_9BURK|nr:NAD-dependent succinate-semialdehyde dehydrogenase [Paracandidimonas soli]TCU97153.1 succinate-semialdehyde dehydrogenase/glutarate-semialdehyde dehydrogenase [Paracandidimonas soli]